MTLILESGQGSPSSNTFALLETAKALYNKRWGYEHLSDSAECAPDDDKLKRALAASSYEMWKMPFVGAPSHCDQGLAWPRCLCEPRDYRSVPDRYGAVGYGWSTHGAGSRHHVGPDQIPDRVIEATILLAADIYDGLLDPTGRTKPVKTSSVSTEAGSISFHRPQVLMTGQAGLAVRNSDPLYAVRRLLNPWFRIEVPRVRMRRG